MTTTTKRTRTITFVGKAGRFLWNFVRMCLPGCLGALILSVAFFAGATLIGYPDLIVQAPVFSTLVLTINFTLPMVAWMSSKRGREQPNQSALRAAASGANTAFFVNHSLVAD